MKISSLLFAFLTALSFTGCYYDVQEEIYPCNVPVEVTYSVDVQPIIQSNCYGCHSTGLASSKGAGIYLESYDSLKARIDENILMCAIKHEGCSPMPKNSSKLSTCVIREIDSWINAGAQNN